MDVRLRLTYAAVVGSALALGCASSTEPSALAHFSTDRGSYTAVPLNPPGIVAQYGFTVVTRVQNRSRAPMFFESCGHSPVLEFGVELFGASDPEGSAYNAGWSCPAGPPKLLVPGAERLDTLMLRGPNFFTGCSQPQAQGRLNGQRRIVLRARTCSAATGCTAETASREVYLKSSEFSVGISSDR